MMTEKCDHFKWGIHKLRQHKNSIDMSKKRVEKDAANLPLNGLLCNPSSKEATGQEERKQSTRQAGMA